MVPPEQSAHTPGLVTTSRYWHLAESSFLSCFCLKVILKPFSTVRKLLFSETATPALPSAKAASSGAGLVLLPHWKPARYRQEHPRSELCHAIQRMRIWGFLCQLFLDTFLLHKYRTRDQKGLGHFLKTIPQPQRANTT